MRTRRQARDDPTRKETMRRTSALEQVDVDEQQLIV